MEQSTRAGRWVRQLEGYRAFEPAPLPPSPQIELNGHLSKLLSRANRCLGRLDGVISVLPNPNLFVAMYVRREAVLSSQIEGTQSTLQDVLAFEADSEPSAAGRDDVEEIVNYVRAMNHGLTRLKELPVCNRLIKEIHRELMAGVRGSERTPGEFRRSQNWIGPAGCTLTTARFVPPHPSQLGDALANLERFINDERDLPLLIHVGLVHAQFETLHPFLDGNGRVGRLLITLLLRQRDAMQRPLLYLSLYLKAHRSAYYEHLTAIREQGDWEGWLAFFLQGVADVSESATESARAILSLQEELRQAELTKTGRRLLEHLFANPVVNSAKVQALTESSAPAANRAISELEAQGFLEETTGKRRNRKYRFAPYIEIFDRPLIAHEAISGPNERTQPDLK